ncbi:hypothetical protein H0H81_010997 [Sphagnurus paluster]|uniref:Uncharacterized protein n=1 Tax=Sphagnurus paluster TaxID=117069 RepID=A0A9P7GUN4_9AGAR|nr:hypothetical protein H0H81_010997 [Sphagnurus paluster]
MTPRPTRLVTPALVNTSNPLLSTTYKGTAFEERARRVLQANLSMSLRRVGGKSDGGIDLLGWWWLPRLRSTDPSDPRRRIRVYAQCKAEKKKLGPKYAREMEGVFMRHIPTPSQALSPHDCLPDELCPQGVKTQTIYPSVALLISESPFTKATVLHTLSSPVPFFLLHLPPLPIPEDVLSPQNVGDDNLGSAIWNPALAGARGLLGGEIEARWERSTDGGGRPGLWWCNNRLKNWIPDVTEDLDAVPARNV